LIIDQNPVLFNNMRALDKTLVWKTYAIWATWVGITFMTIYPTCNWLTANRVTTYHLYIHAELGIPFIPGFFWVYMSLYLLFLMPPFFLNVEQLKRLGKQLILATLFSAIIFLLLPAELGFKRIIPKNEFYASLYSDMFHIDLPHNLVPSLHVIFSALILLSLLDAKGSTIQKTIWWGWLILICLSTLLVHQHHILDVSTGLLVAIGFRKYYNKGEDHA
jgi:membrane-associated phospholipid phosphatase